MRAAARPHSRGSPPAPRSPTSRPRTARTTSTIRRRSKGWVRPSLGLRGMMLDVGALPEHGVPAPDWVTDKENPFNLSGFLDQYAKAVTGATPGERSRAMAGALVAAGAMIHVLGDLGNPSRVRGDDEAHFQQLGGGPDDLGSRFERIAALAYGRLGIPAPSRVITRQHLRDYFTSADGAGLRGRDREELLLAEHAPRADAHRRGRPSAPRARAARAADAPQSDGREPRRRHDAARARRHLPRALQGRARHADVLDRRRLHARAARDDLARDRRRTRPACSTSCSAAS